MPPNPPVVDEAEGFLRDVAIDLLRPHDRECLCCYVARLLADFPCDGSHRHVLRYRDARAPGATALLARLGRIGACCCDCELFLNAYELESAASEDDLENEDGNDDEFDDEDDDEDEDEDEDVQDYLGLTAVPPCRGARRGSTQPCRNWVRIRKW